VRGEFADAGVMRDFDRLAALFTPDAVWRIPAVDARFEGRDEIRAGVERLLEGFWAYLLQGAAPGHDPARRRHRVWPRLRAELRSGARGRFAPELLRLSRPLPADSGRPAFAERVDEVKYLDTSPLTGSPPRAPNVS